jgi:hypothetical protein
MFGGTRRSFAVCQPALSISIVATETWVSTSAAPVSRAGQTAPKIKAER